MKKVLLLSLCVATLMSCGQKQGPSEQEIQERIDAAVEAALEEKSANESTTNISDDSETTTNAVSEDASTNLKEKAYKEGYDIGIAQSHLLELDSYLDENEKSLKMLYMNGVATEKCLGEEHKTNKELFAEFKRGFIQGHKDGNAL